jgi:hypothetical protein
LEPLPDIYSLFATGADVAANAAEDLGAFERAKASGDLLAHFHHADVLFG